MTNARTWDLEADTEQVALDWMERIKRALVSKV
jgi:hypothetical protein